MVKLMCWLLPPHPQGTGDSKVKGNNMSGNNGPHGNAAQQCTACARVCTAALFTRQPAGSRERKAAEVGDLWWFVVIGSDAVSLSSRRRSWRSRVFSSRVLDLHCPLRKWMQHPFLPIYLLVWVSMRYGSDLWIGPKGLTPSPGLFFPWVSSCLMSFTGLPIKFYDMKMSKQYCDGPRTMNTRAASFTESSAEPCKIDCMFSGTGKFYDLEESIGFFKFWITKCTFY